MSYDPHADGSSAARARLSGDATNPADNDFEGCCVQCLQPNARPLTIFEGHTPLECNAFCSIECAERFAFEMANFSEPEDIVEFEDCPHDVPDGDYCPKCRDEFLARARAKQIGGAA